MSHHGESPFDRERQAKMAEEFRRLTQIEGVEERKRAITRSLLDTTGFVGGTGLHPDGKMTPEDEGGIQFRVGSENGKVVLDFGKPVHWVGMDAQQAADLASSLMKWARLVGRKNGETITVNLGST